MTNNYVFQRLLATFDLSRNHDLINKVFELGGQKKHIVKSLIKSWKTHKTDSPHYKPMPDSALKMFLDGLQKASMEGLITIYLNDA